MLRRRRKEGIKSRVNTYRGYEKKAFEGRNKEADREESEGRKSDQESDLMETPHLLRYRQVKTSLLDSSTKSKAVGDISRETNDD